MKRIVSVAAAGLALAVLSVFSPASLAGDESDVPNNGITYFEKGGQTAATEGSGAGGLSETSPGKEPYNGITFFETGSKAAPKSTKEEASATPYNGITVFQ